MNINTVGTNNTIANNAINTTSAGIIYGITTAAGNDNIFSNTINVDLVGDSCHYRQRNCNYFEYD
jgi:hypothetical protein